MARLGSCSLSSQFVFGGGTLRLLQLKFQLIKQARDALRACPIKLTFVLLDLPLESDDQRVVLGQLRGGLSFNACNLGT